MHKFLLYLKGSDKRLSIKEVAEFLGVSTDTLRRWEKVNKIKSVRTTGGHSRYEQKEE